MRIRFLLLITAFGMATPATAQPNVERRVDRLEQEMRAVQRRVFPGGVAATVDPEILPPAPVQRPAIETGDAIGSLAARIDALEAQLARVTGQVEENGYRLSQFEEQFRRFRTDTQSRVQKLEEAAAAAAAPPPAAEPQPEAQAPSPAAAPSQADTNPEASARPLDAAQAAYNAGFKLWEERKFAEAATALTAVAQRHPNSRWASWARNLAGRAYLDDNKPANAARIFLENYQANPRGERAADSLFFLGEALVKLDRRTEACPVYDELAAKYPDMRAFLRERLPAARRAARCS